MTWKVASYTSSSINFNLNFTVPEAVSQEEDPDMLLILLNLDDFETSYGERLPVNTLLSTTIPK